MMGNSIIVFFLSLISLSCTYDNNQTIMQIKEISILEGDYEAISSDNVYKNASVPVVFKFFISNKGKEPIVFYENKSNVESIGGIMVDFKNQCFDSLTIRFAFAPRNRAVTIPSGQEKEVEVLGYFTRRKKIETKVLNDPKCNFTFKSVIKELVNNSSITFTANSRYLSTYKYLHNLGNVDVSSKTREFQISTQGTKIIIPKS